MKTKLFLTLLAVLAWLPAGCSSNAGVSVGHEGHTHGASMGTHADHSGVGATANVR